MISYVMVSKRTTMTCYYFNYIMSSMAFVIVGLVNADTHGLNLPFETEMYYLEHFLPIFGVLILFMSGRYKPSWLSGKEMGFVGFSWWVLYVRVICWTMSELTGANIICMLCAHETDIIYKKIGMWYYVSNEFSCFFLSFLVRYSLLAVGYIIRGFLTISVMNTSMDDVIKKSLFLTQGPGTKNKTD